MLIRLSQPSGLFVALDEVKKHVVVETSDDDALLTGYIKAATRFAEDRTGRILQQAEFEFRAERWCAPIVVPAAPVREVTAIRYLDEDDSEATLDAGDWYATTTPDGTEVRFTDSFGSPVLSDRPQSVRVAFSAGYDDPDASGSGDDPMLVQDEIDRLIVMMLAAHWYETREPVSIGQTVASMPFSAEALIGVRRIFR